MVLTLCFDAISRNVDGLGYSPFVMFSMTSVTKFPASLVILLLQDRLWRKAMASGSLLISCVFTIASGLVIAFVGAKSGNSHLLSYHTCNGMLPGATPGHAHNSNLLTCCKATHEEASSLPLHRQKPRIAVVYKRWRVVKCVCASHYTWKNTERM